MIGNKLELTLGFFGKLVVGKAKGKMGNTGCEVVANALYDSLLCMVIDAEAG
jgi:hypothetical protein